MSLALMVDAEGDQEIIGAQNAMRATLDDWIPKILAAQHPDGYLQSCVHTSQCSAAEWAGVAGWIAAAVDGTVAGISTGKS